MTIDKPILGQVTQGSIFTAAVAEGYSVDPVWGFCITARCDVAHEGKAQVFNYVPVVRFEDWLLVDGGRLLIDRVYAELFNDAKNCIKSINKSVSVLDSHHVDHVFHVLFPSDEEKKSKNGVRFATLATQISRVKSIENSARLAIGDVTDLADLKRSTSEKLIKEVWSNKLQGYYFLESIGDTEFPSSLGYVVLLREIHHIPRVIAHKIASGADELSCSNGNLNFSVFDFSQVVGKLKSPWVEHLMQSFALLFSRIGLVDPAVDKYNSLCEVLKK